MGKQEKQSGHSTKTLAIRGVLFNWIGRGCSFVITFVATPIILGALGNEAYGLWAIVMSVGSYYAMADMGMHAACTKYIAEFEAKGDRDSTSRLISTSILLYSVMAAMVLAAAVPVAWFFPRLFEIQGSSVHDIRWAVFLTGVSVAIRLQAQVFVSTIKALKRFDIANGISVVAQILQATLLIWAVVTGYGLVGMAWVLVGTTLASRMAEACFAAQLLGGLNAKLWAFDVESFRKVFRFSSWNVVAQMANRTAGQSTPLIIGILLGPATVPFFTLGNSVIQKVTSLTAGVGGVVMPVASELHAQQRKAALLRITVLSARLMVSIALICAAVVWLIGESFIELWVGPGYAETVGPVLALLSAAFIADMVSGGARSVFAGMGRVDTSMKLNSLLALLTVVSVVMLTLRHGVVGAAWGILASRIVVNTGICPALTCRLLECSWINYMRRVLLGPMVVLISGLATGFLVSLAGEPATLWQWFGMAGTMCAVMGLTMFIVCLDRKLQSDVVASLPLGTLLSRIPRPENTR